MHGANHRLEGRSSKFCYCGGRIRPCDKRDPHGMSPCTPHVTAALEQQAAASTQPWPLDALVGALTKAGVALFVDAIRAQR